MRIINGEMKLNNTPNPKLPTSYFYLFTEKKPYSQLAVQKNVGSKDVWGRNSTCASSHPWLPIGTTWELKNNTDE